MGRKKKVEERLEKNLMQNPILDNLQGDVITDDPRPEFILAIENSMEGSLIRYSKRLELLDLAKKLQLDRFEANLMIAQVQQEKKHLPVPKNIHEDQQEKSLRDKFFMAAALFIVVALFDMMIIKLFFAG